MKDNCFAKNAMVKNKIGMNFKAWNINIHMKVNHYHETTVFCVSAGEVCHVCLKFNFIGKISLYRSRHNFILYTDKKYQQRPSSYVKYYFNQRPCTPLYFIYELYNLSVICNTESV